MLLTHKHPREGVVIICPDGTRILVRIIKPADQRSERTTLGVGPPRNYLIEHLKPDQME